MKWILRKWKLHQPDEMERYILFKAQRNAYLFLVAALLAWSLYESGRVWAGQGSLNLLPCLLLVAAALIQSISQSVLMRNAVKDNEETRESGPLVKLIALLCAAAGLIASAAAMVVLMGARV